MKWHTWNMPIICDPSTFYSLSHTNHGCVVLNYWLYPCIILSIFLLLLSHEILFDQKPIFYSLILCALHCVKKNKRKNQQKRRVFKLGSVFFFEYHKYLLLSKQRPHIYSSMFPRLLAIKFDLLIGSFSYLNEFYELILSARRLIRCWTIELKCFPSLFIHNERR